jgi:hypothetical protein
MVSINFFTISIIFKMLLAFIIVLFLFIVTDVGLIIRYYDPAQNNHQWGKWIVVNNLLMDLIFILLISNLVYKYKYKLHILDDFMNAEGVIL